MVSATNPLIHDSSDSFFLKNSIKALIKALSLLISLEHLKQLLYFGNPPLLFIMLLNKLNSQKISFSPFEELSSCVDAMSAFQYVFRCYHSISAPVLKATEDIRLSMEDGQVTVLLLLGFSQAFDMVVLCKLWSAQNCSVGASSLVGSNSYLGERAQFVRSGGQKSSVGAVTCRVPQGSVLGLLLLISYIDDDGICRFHINADDLQIYHTLCCADFQMCIDDR
jgi:hypothetical protein